MPASANLPGSSFEGNDGNQVLNGNPNTAHDWINAPNREVGNDLTSGQTDNSFGNGTQEKDLNVTVGLGSIPNSKADLGQFATASETLANGDVMMYLAWTRNNTSGSTNFDFEINKAAQPDLTTPGPKTLVRTTGDLLINYSVQGGAQVPTLNYRTWQANGTWSGVTALAAPIAEAAINTSGSIANTLGGPATIPASQFGEAAINMTEAGIIANQNDPNAPCAGFGSAYVKSRASQSFTSEIKDFIAPIPLHLNTCGTIVIEKVTDPSPDTTDTSFDFTLTGEPDFSLKNGESYSTGSDVKAGDGYVAAEDVPTGWNLDTATCDNGSPVTNIVVTAGQTTTCTFTNIARANLHVVKVAERDGVDFDFTSNTLTPATFTLQNGDTQDFNSIAPGGYDVAETVPDGWNLDSATCDNGDDPATITLVPGDNVTCTFTNVVERGAVLIHKSAKHADSETGTIDQAGVTFTVTNANGTDEAVVTDASGNACLANVPVSLLDGAYTVTETVPAGYHSADDEQDYTVVADSTCESATALQFSNIPLTNVTVSVDSQVDGGTSSVIECGGAPVTTDANGDGFLTVSDLEPTDPAVTLTCTITVDP